MRDRTQQPRAWLISGVIGLALAVGTRSLNGAAAQQPQVRSAMAAAPVDLTGYWVSVVTEDWRWRMITPVKGDYSSVPLNLLGRRVTDDWDPTKDVAADDACKSYGAAAIMRVPGRLHVTWDDPNTLKIETDAGQQTRLLHFGDSESPAAVATWQGYSVAAWEFAGGRAGRGDGRAGLTGGSLKVETTHLKAGYLRKNGVPYSENTVMTEYFDRHTELNGDLWLVVITTVHDQKYLNQDFTTSTHFKREPDESRWHPTPCSAT